MKTWQKVTIGILVLAFIGQFLPDTNKEQPSPTPSAKPWSEMSPKERRENVGLFIAGKANSDAGADLHIKLVEMTKRSVKYPETLEFLSPAGDWGGYADFIGNSQIIDTAYTLSTFAHFRAENKFGAKVRGVVNAKYRYAGGNPELIEFNVE